jgi:hypothetical protein
MACRMEWVLAWTRAEESGDRCIKGMLAGCTGNAVLSELSRDNGPGGINPERKIPVMAMAAIPMPMSNPRLWQHPHGAEGSIPVHCPCPQQRHRGGQGKIICAF